MIYHMAVYLYLGMIRLSSPFSAKARQWLAGRKGWRKAMEGAARQGPAGGEALQTIWFHCASLGEFEQGRPVIEDFRKQHPGWRILLTFFSPSGYRHRKDFPHADHVFYLPADTPSNVRFFLDTWQPQAAVFVKYEYWYNYLDVLSRRGIPHIVISAIFRPGQYFFRPWGGWPRRQLARVTHFFVQDKESARLLEGLGIRQQVISGDTRFDRVHELARNQRDLPDIGSFAGDKPVLVAGSTWPKDDGLLAGLLDGGKVEKLIVAPHETGPIRLDGMKAIYGDAVTLSDYLAGEGRNARVLLIDRIGILSRLYPYGKIAYIGGGFGQGIHNILEAATYGVPVMFGPRHEKFAEARDLLKLGGAFCVSDRDSLAELSSALLSDENKWRLASDACRQYVEKQRGATGRIMEWLSAQIVRT